MSRTASAAIVVQFPKVDLEQFRLGFMVFLSLLNEQAEPDRAPSDGTFNRALIAAGARFEGEVLRLNFYQRLELFGSLARDSKYDSYIGFCRPSAHLAFVAALACFRFSSEMTEKACIAAFDEELKRQLGEAREDLRRAPGGRGRRAAAGMDKATLQQHLDTAEGHIDDARRRIDRQTSLLNELKAAGRETVLAERLLVQFKRTLAALQANRDLITDLLRHARR
jgi:hypothetical protein